MPRRMFKKTERFFMISVTNPCAELVKVVEKEEDGDMGIRVKSKATKASAPHVFKTIRTSKKDRQRHGFGLKNVQSAAENYDGEFSATCEERPYGFEFRAEILFPVRSDL